MTYYKPTRLELLIFLFCLALMGYIGVRLYNHLQASSRLYIEQSLRLGQILEVQGDVKIRPSDSFMWDDARAKLYIADKDKIFNGTNSKAKILLVDNTAIELGANTLVQFFRDKEGAVGIDVTSGRLNIDNVLTDKNKLSQMMLDTQDLDCSGVDIDFEGGSTDIRELQKRIACRQIVKKEALTYKSISPTQDEKLYDAQPLSLKWRKINDEESPETVKLVIEKLEKSNFKVSEKIPITTGTSLDHPGLTAGTYQWYLESKNTKLSQNQPFRILAIPFPTLLEPQTETVTYGDKLETTFKWQRKFGTERTRLQVASDPQFQTVVIDQETAYTGYEPTEAEAEKLKSSPSFFWRLIPQLPDLDILATPQITVPQKKTSVITAASKIFPNDNFVFDESPLNMQTVSFQWPEIDAQRYGFELVDVNGRILSSSTPLKGEMRVERLPPGSYQWSVTRMDDRLPKEILFNFSFDIIAKLSAEELLQIGKDDVSFITSQNELAPLKWDVEFNFLKTNFVLENFDISFVNLENPTDLLKEDQQITGKKRFMYRKLEPTNYQLQLRQKGTSQVALSYAVDLKASPIGPPKAVHLVLESREDASRILHMNWPRVDLAQSYEVQIFHHDDTGLQPIATEKVLTTETNSLTILEDPNLLNKRFMIVATSIDPVGRESVPLQKDFVIKY
jgi:hypothetical protein